MNQVKQTLRRSGMQYYGPSDQSSGKLCGSPDPGCHKRKHRLSLRHERNTVRRTGRSQGTGGTYLAFL